ncbi:unnamed protein product [Protopolystoma xenopodis]|uniref:Uncharacterized protein n=1 Tax=Protopolystoma xenopodis TaxID=117903 RepID=A0A448X4Z1_9PLAT|nr:unnamed protein product [Protopolystoma xenopodis]
MPRQYSLSVPPDLALQTVLLWLPNTQNTSSHRPTTRPLRLNGLGKTPRVGSLGFCLYLPLECSPLCLHTSSCASSSVGMAGCQPVLSVAPLYRRTV